MLRAAILAFAVAALGVAIFSLSGSPTKKESPSEENRTQARAPKKAKKAVSEEQTPAPELPPQWRSAPIKPGSLVDKAPPPPPPGPGLVKSQDEAVEIYENFMGRLADIETGRGSLSEGQKDKLYRDASNVLAGLSEQFDADNPDEMAYLEGARGAVLEQLRRMKIQPPKPPMRPPTKMRRPADP